MRSILIAIIGITAVLPATLRAADDENLAAEFVFCSVITEFAGAFARTDTSKQYWVQQQKMYLELALRLASKDFLRNEVPRAIERRKKLYDDSGSLEMVRANTAAALGSCESSFKANQLRIVGIAEAARAKQGSIENFTPIAFPIPDQDWTITVVSPPLTKMKEERSPDQYQYLGVSGRLMLSLFVESPRCNKGAAHEDVYKCLSEKGLTKIPNVDSASVKVAAFQSYYRLSYDVNLPTDGGVVKHRNVHYMFSHSGKWIDLHISIVGPTDSDTDFLESFEKALHYGPGNSEDSSFRSARCGAVDLGKVLRESEPGRRARARLEREFKPWDERLVGQLDPHNALQRKWLDAKSAGDTQREGELRKELDAMGARLEEEKQKFRNALSARQNQEMGTLLKKVEASYIAFGESQGYDKLFQISYSQPAWIRAGTAELGCSAKADDLTDAVIAVLNDKPTEAE